MILTPEKDELDMGRVAPKTAYFFLFWLRNA